MLCRSAVYEHHRLLSHTLEVRNVMLGIMAGAASVNTDQHLSQSPRALALLARQELQAEFLVLVGLSTSHAGEGYHTISECCPHGPARSYQNDTAQVKLLQFWVVCEVIPPLHLF